MRLNTIAQNGRSLLFGLLAVASGASASIGADSYLYFRCNSTSWDANEKSRLQSTTTSGVFELTFDVNQPWMTAVGDECVLTETPVLNSWGSWQKYYKPQGYPVLAPTTTELYEEPAGLPTNFKLRFPKPGTYKAVVDIKTMTLTVSRLGELNPGDLVWDASGQIVLDVAQNLYRVTPNRTTLQKLNRTTGTALWSYTSPTSVYVNPSCIDAGTMFVQDGSGASVTALVTATGAKQWNTVLTTALDLSGVYTGGLSCPTGATTVLFYYYGNGLNGLAALNRTTGALAWKKATANNVSILVTTKDLLVYSIDHADYNSKTIVAANPTTGAQLWSNTTTEPWEPYFGDASGNLFRTLSSAVQRINPLTGAVLWTHSYTGLQLYRLESDGLYLTGSAYVEKINKATGALIWSAGDRTSANYATFVVDPSGRCLQYQQNSDVTSLNSINCTTGAVLFSKNYVGGGWPNFDKQGRLYLVTQQLQQLGPTGNILWTYAPPFIDGYGQSRMNMVIDSDASSVYASYAAYLYYSVASGIVALSPTNGAVRWNHMEPLGMYFAGSDSKMLYMIEANRGGPVQGLAFLK